jgi:sensor histidine kinase regulating citrate/malate metabolism
MASVRRGEIFQLLTNLLLNAIEALPHSGNLHVRVVLRSSTAVITIADNGAGIPEALGYHLKTGHTLSVQNRPTRLAEDVIVLPCCSVRLQGLRLSPRSGV